jgi:iron(III) transport system ATP-binding protein
MTTLAVSGVDKTFPGPPPVHALVGVDLTVQSGTLLAVLGPSGCGKTTLLRVVAGFERPDAGTIRLGERVVSTAETVVPPERRTVGIVPQDGGLFPHLDVAGNIAFGLRRIDKQQRRARVAELLDLIGLPGLEGRRPHELSGGQRQRVALARALAPDPSVVLLDEPFGALDTSLRMALREDVRGVLERSGTTAILVTHDQGEALSMADEVAVMRAGRVIQVAAPTELYHQPVDLETARMLGECNTLHGSAVGDAVDTRLGRLPLARNATVGDDVTVLVRPEQVVPAESGIAATVLHSRFEGSTVHVRLLLDDMELTALWSSTVVPRTGSTRAIAIVGPVMTYPDA